MGYEFGVGRFHNSGMVIMANIKSVDRIISAKDYGGSARQYIRKQQHDILTHRGVAVTIKDLDKEPTGTPVHARIWQGQWIADCCNASCFVDPHEPVFFCFQCGNRANGGKPRPVIFPPEAERLEIERLLLERPVDDYVGLTDMERAGMARNVLDVEVEVEEAPGIPEMMEALQTGKPPKGQKVIRRLPLCRSWEPGETVEDLRKQQEEPIRKWKAALKDGKHGVQ